MTEMMMMMMATIIMMNQFFVSNYILLHANSTATGAEYTAGTFRQKKVIDYNTHT
jgi:hypothetical protein